MPQIKVREGHRATAAWLRALEMTAPIAKNPERTFPVLFDELGEMFGDSCALLGDDGRLSFAALSARVNQYARWAIDQGLRKGDVVCLHMANRIEYLAVWLGITRVGGVVALSNTNLAGQSLAYCVNSVRPKHVIVGSGLADQVSKIKPLIACRGLWSIGEADSDFPRIDHEIERYAGCRLSGAECRAVTLDDLALFVYTSGTTGLPKAARIPHRRIMQWSHWFAGLIDVQPRDRMYDCLPLYHSVGGIVATGAVLIKGGSVVIRQKFSAQRFWEDVAKWDCTLFQYIGELCRYLVQAPPHLQERAHRLRLCCGNGLRSDVWTAFQERFAIPEILEFYAATEGNVSLYNLDGRPGSIGRVPSFLKHRSNLALVRLDMDTNQLVRGDAGFCIPCKPNEPGEAIGRIEGAPGRESRFEGYCDAKDDAPKIARGVFKTGDAWFRTGDLLRMDDDGYFYFVDRIGDTFRWKGENVSTTEVSQALLEYPGVVDAAVYGVALPGYDGRIGMAGLVVDQSFAWSGLLDYLDGRLPRYAHPAFVRLCPAIGTTPTFKQQKADLAAQAYSPGAVGEDPIYFNDPRKRAFVRLDARTYDCIRRRSIRF